MRLEHHLVGGYVRYISPYIIIIMYMSSHECKANAFVIDLQIQALNDSIPNYIQCNISFFLILISQVYQNML